MKISIIPQKYGEQLSRDGLDGIPQAYRNELFNDLKEENSSVNVQAVNYGGGADWIWILVTLGGFYKVITEGDKIDKGLSGWSNILKKIKKLLKKSRSVKLDADVLLLIAASKVFTTHKKVTELQFVHQFEIDLVNNSPFFSSKPASDFLCKDEAYTIFILKAATDLYFVVGVHINGQCEILKTLEAPKLDL
ncbi:MAG TPA: hypothetical protein VMR70_08595 [Flavisolibacter sp.]|nr:hypothetical protein [Flavisolibacter sp.]